MDMEINLTETRSRITKTVKAESSDYNLTATAVIEDGKIVTINGNVMKPSENNEGPEGIYFEGRRVNGELKVNYHNIAADERETIGIISAMVDAVVAKYEE